LPRKEWIYFFDQSSGIAATLLEKGRTAHSALILRSFYAQTATEFVNDR